MSSDNCVIIPPRFAEFFSSLRWKPVIKLFRLFAYIDEVRISITIQVCMNCDLQSCMKEWVHKNWEHRFLDNNRQ